LRRLAAIDRAESFLRRLFDALALPPRAARRALADRLRELLRYAGLWRAAGADTAPERCARDLKALAALEEVLDEVALLDEGTGDEVALEAFLTEVTQGLELARVRAEEPGNAPVVVLDVVQSRALSFDHVFLLGLAEREFPRRGRRHPFFDDAERRHLRRFRVDLADAGHDAQAEMLLAYLAMTRANRSLVLAYSTLDGQGRPALASHYLEQVKGLFAAEAGGEPLPVTDVAARDLDLPEGRLRCPRELLASTMFGLWGPGETSRPEERLAVLDALLARGPAAETALAGLAAEWEREHGDAFSPFDGLLAAPEILDELCRRFPGSEPLSAKRLDAFGACPFAFFASEILELVPLEEPSPDLGPMDVGIIYHGLLERFFSAIAAPSNFGGTLTQDNFDRAMAVLDETAAAYFKGLEAYGRVGSPALWKIQKRDILRDVRRMLAWHADKLTGWRAAWTEVPFGAPGVPLRPPGRREPISLDSPHGPVLLRGRIDRLDLAADGSGHQVIDYKTSSAPSANAMEAGTSFQLPIYLWAAEVLLSPEERGDRAEAFFLPVRHPARSGRLRSTDAKGGPSEKFRRVMDAAKEYVRRFVDAMRRGLYPVYPRQECSGYCPFQEVCRYAEWRIERKWQAHPIPQLGRIAPAAPADGEDDA
jgi:hypothetical protein